MKPWFVVILTVLAATPCQAQIYKWRLPDGSTEYSDRAPEKGAERVELPPLTTYTPPAASAPGSATGRAGTLQEFDGYQRFSIAAPVNNATVRDNAGNVRLTFAVTPALVEGHAIEVFLDGEKSGRVGVPLLTLANVSRGFHEIHAIIVDESGTELARTGTVYVEVKRVSDQAPNPDVAAPQAPEPTYPGGASSFGGPASPGGPESPGGVVSPGGSDPRFGATSSPLPPTPPSP